METVVYMDPEDLIQLQRYVERNDEHAFRWLVLKYTNLVYSAAIRQTEDPELAQEVSQAVFIVLARRASSIRRSVPLAGWLITTARFAARNAIRGERRRQRRDMEAYQMQATNQSAEDDANNGWELIAPKLDEGLEAIGRSDRDAIILRFLQNKSLKEVGIALGSGEEAARKRVARAMDRLRRWFETRQVTVSSVVLASLLSAHGVQASPAALASTLTAGGLASTQTTSTSTAFLVKQTLKLMALNKLKTSGIAALVVLLTCTSAIVITQRVNSVDAGDNTDRIQDPGTVFLDVDGTPGTKFTAWIRVGGKVDEIRNGQMPMSLEVPGRPFDAAVVLSDGPGVIQFKARTINGSLGDMKLSGSAGAKIHVTTGGVSGAGFDPKKDAPPIMNSKLK